ncbi:MAG TPA: hypothetical protein VGM84_04130 [Steroidobacteraceae bacterium]|jgi:uncharacterized membrane protein YozB (DUF420 family)
MSSEAPNLSVTLGKATSGTRRSFFFIAHAVLLVIVLLGFSPSFYLRAAFHHTTQLPSLLYAHGTALTVWFLLTVAQGWLIRTQRHRLHRLLGYVAATYAVVVIVLGTLANLMLISEIDSPADGENIVVWGNFFTLVMFATFVSLAVLFRKNPEAHKRLMLVASLSIVGPALARLPRWPVFAGGLEAGRNYAIAGLLIMFASLITYDVIVRKKPHPASWGGMVAILMSLAGAVFLGVTGIGFHLLHR